MNSIESRFSNLISYVFHPLVIPTYATIVLLNLKYFFLFIIPLKYKLILLANVFGFTCIMPALIVFFLYKISFITSYRMEEKNERAMPLLITGIFYYLTYYLLRQISLPSILYNFFLGAALLSLFAIGINFFWKISLHCISVGAFVGALMILLFKYDIDTSLWLLIILPVSGIISSARLGLNSHSPAQVYAGHLLGFILMGAIYFLI
jgi:hypothetical protein